MVQLPETQDVFLGTYVTTPASLRNWRLNNCPGDPISACTKSTGMSLETARVSLASHDWAGGDQRLNLGTEALEEQIQTLRTPRR